MIYFDDTIKTLQIFAKNKVLDFEHINNKSNLKGNELKQILNYLLYYGYLDLYQNANYQITDIGERYLRCFTDYNRDTALVLNRLHDSFPKTLTKKECAEGIQSNAFKDVILFLKDKGYIQMVSTTTSYEMVRISESGFLLIDYFSIKKKLNQLLD